MMITFHAYFISALMVASSVFQHVAAQVPTRQPTSKKPTTRKPVAPAGTQPPNLQLMQFTTGITKEQVVASLIASNGDVEFMGVEATGNLAACAALYTGGHTLGTLMERGPGPDYELATDVQGNYIPTTTNIVPNVGIILSSGDPRNFNWNDKDDETKAFSDSSMTNHKLVQDLRNDVNNQSGNPYNSFFDACAISFKFRCTNDAYVPVVSFKYSFGSEEYYEYVDSAFNDAFGFYLNQQNIAFLPTTTTNSRIVSINNVNYNENKQYFHGNDPGLGWQTEKPDAPYSEVVYPRIEADGFTDILTATGSPNPNPLIWNNMTLVVADVGDAILDSWVVLESSSFTCVDVTSAPSISSAPSDAPTLAPTTSKPSSTPTSTPSSYPTTLKPTTTPTSNPTTSAPSLMPTTSTPTSTPSSKPTTSKPTSTPSIEPTTSKPSSNPSPQPTTSNPTFSPSSQPTTSKPTSTPSYQPTTYRPSSVPTSKPTTSIPTSTPTTKPTTSKPTPAPSSFPTTSKPTSTPTSNPSVSSEPSGLPSMGPSFSSKPSVAGSHAPSISSSPSSAPSAAGKVGPQRIWYDADEDGIEDITEDPLPGVNVTLWCTNGNGTFIKIGTVTTDANGTYEFDQIQPSTCYISVLPQLNGTNYTFSPVVSGGNQIYPNGTSPLGNVTFNSVNDDWGVGMVLPKADIGPNAVFYDIDKDGIQDVGEPPMAGVIVTLICDGSVRASDTTGADGVYEFKNVLPGNCYISVFPEVDDNDNYVFSPITPNGVIGNKIFQNGTSPTITVVYNNATHNDWNVGMYLPPATIGPNKVFDDEDGDGFRDPGEESLANVTVGLYCYHENGTALLVAINVTDSNGEYVLYNVQPGACFIQVSPNVNNQTYSFSPIVPNGNQIHPNGTSPVVNVTWNDVVKNLDVGMYLSVTIGDKVWEDLNGNGLQDDDEAGKANVTVKLINASGATVATTTTDALGMYKFTNLPPGKYGVRFTLPPTYEFSPVFEFQSSPGGPDITLSDAVFTPIILENSGASPREGHIPAQTLESGEISKTFDAGIFVPVIVGGTVFDDKNGNGVQNPGEPGLSGAKITATNTLTGESHSIFSNSTGGYSLNLMPGEYIAAIVPPSPDFTLSPLSTPGTATGNDFDPSTRSTQVTSLRSGQSGVGSFDAGFYAPVTIENIVWDDVNANGIFDQGEVGYTGAMTVTLYAAGSSVPFKNTTTAADGSFKFVDIPPGAYEIEFKKSTAGSSFTLQNAGNDDLRDSDVDPNTGRAPLTVVSGADISDITAGITALPSIGPNQVFEDDDGDGIPDAGEKGLPNVLVTLYNFTNSPVATVLTDSNGAYSFVSLIPGTYYISVNKDPDFKFSPVVVGGNQISPSVEFPLLNKSPPVTLAIGMNDKTLMVGMYKPANTGNKVWNDLNGDGIQQKNEPGMVDVTVHLYDKSGVRINSTNTDVDGHYIFTDLTPGSYSVKFILPDRFVFTVQAKSSFVVVDPTHPDNSTLYEDVTSDADRITGMTPFKFIKSGDDYYSFDAGMFIPITVNGTTWHDLNADGFNEGDEPGLASVVVTLYDYDGDEVTSTTTGANGVWKFDEMPPGTYHVKITPPTDPSGKVFMISPKPANQTSRSDFDLITMKSTPKYFEGGSSSGGFFDVGLYLPATIGDRIWFDDTPNGIQDGDEKSYDIPITVNLYDALGYKVKETISTDTGFYQFTGVKPGSYSIEFILSDEDYKFTIPHAGNNTDIDSDVSPSTGRASVTVTSGETKTNIDAGVMDFGPYYPEWKNDVQVCTNDGFDPLWLENQKVNYLYDNKEACCRQHFWWRMTQCMANEEFKFYKNEDKCDSKIYFEDWELNSPAAWTDTTLFDTVEECCANLFWFDYDACVGRSPVMFKFEFCVDIKGLTDPQDCQSADIFANVIEAAMNEGCYHTQGLSDTVFNNTGSSGHVNITSADTNITKIGSVSLGKVLGTTVCGGSLEGEDFINELTGTVPDLLAAANKNITVCGVITVKEQECKDAACLNEHYTAVKEELNRFVDDGDLTLAINRLATTRLPPVPEMLNVIGAPLSLTMQNLVLPTTITGDVNFKYFRGSNLQTCEEKVVFMPNEVSYEKLHDCCRQHFQWNVNLCCAKGGGCPEIDVVASPNNSTVQTVRYYPTWVAGQLCGSKPADQIQAWEQNYATRNECCENHFNFGNELSICKQGNL